MEKIAIPIWQDRISPVLDTAARLMVIQTGAANYSSGETIYIPPVSVAERARMIIDLNVEVVICGALSRALHVLLLNAGIRIYPWITGAADEILDAYLRGNLNNEQFLLPGCGRGRRERGHRGCGRRRGRSGTAFPWEK